MTLRGLAGVRWHAVTRRPVSQRWRSFASERHAVGRPSRVSAPPPVGFLE
ncbi:hypothetical protein COLSTE_00940 [Collinsella stercoris DSM 13279]|uniref:Uncharacterized protein n=1 Tax=Collinsella stercoris DSM 13279 TaxID=445975 RepID=B6GA45_9ACTN|nr:hypothetical protein COLSTE_00940 [Collinsella stercoris DSM 13279]